MDGRHNYNNAIVYVNKRINNFFLYWVEIHYFFHKMFETKSHIQIIPDKTMTTVHPMRKGDGPQN